MPIIENTTAFAARDFLSLDKDGADTLVICVCGTFRIPEPGRSTPGELPLADGQPEPSSEDVYWGEPGTSSLRYEGQSAYFRPGTDIYVNGHAWAPLGGGLISSKTKGKLTWATYSPDVKFEGKSVVRFLDICLHNGNKVNTGGNASTGTPSVGLTYGADQKCPICGKETGHELKSNSETSEKEARKLYKKVHKRGQPFRYGEDRYDKGVLKKGEREGFMAGVLLCKPPSGSRPIVMQTHSGRRVPKFPIRPQSSAPDFKPPKDSKLPKNEDYTFKTAGGRTVRVKTDKNYKGNKPGNCAAPG
ncbi:MAG TPA: DUF2169 domain-containing protein [Archangium sp.]|nr:DUF2169 domain-containing protein [Archangium sp.]